MKNVSFCASSKELYRMKRACEELSNTNSEFERINLYTETQGDTAYLSSKRIRRQNTIELNMENEKGTFASAVVKKGSKKDCAKFFEKKDGIMHLEKVFDRLKDILRETEK